MGAFLKGALKWLGIGTAVGIGANAVGVLSEVVTIGLIVGVIVLFISLIRSKN